MTASSTPHRIDRASVSLAVVAAVLIAGLAISASLGFGAALAAGSLEALRHSGAWGPFLFLTVAIVVVLSGVFPASLLGIAAGAIFGLLFGCALAAAGLLVGAALTFALSRSAFRSAIERMLARQSYLQNLDTAVARRGWAFVALARLSPVVPFSAASYLLGLSSIGFRPYLLGTMAALPGLFAYVLCGTLTGVALSTATQGDSPIRWIILGVGAVATLVLLALLGRFLLHPAFWTVSVSNESG